MHRKIAKIKMIGFYKSLGSVDIFVKMQRDAESKVINFLYVYFIVIRSYKARYYRL